jgi:anaerobic ribonucleoside-triphosphate reductase
MSNDIPEEMRTKCQVFSRIVGYYQPTSAWNEGKQAEFKDRKVFKVDKNTTIGQKKN